MNENMKAMMAQNEMVNPSTIWILFLFLGWSYGSMNSMGKQIFYWLTLGGFGIWFFYRLVTLSGAIKKFNFEVASKYSI